MELFNVLQWSVHVHGRLWNTRYLHWCQYLVLSQRGSDLSVATCRRWGTTRGDRRDACPTSQPRLVGPGSACRLTSSLIPHFYARIWVSAFACGSCMFGGTFVYSTRVYDCRSDLRRRYARLTGTAAVARKVPCPCHYRKHGCRPGGMAETLGKCPAADVGQSQRRCL